MKKKEVYVVIGATLYQADLWALKNGVKLNSVIAISMEYDHDKLRGLHGQIVTFVGRDQWWMSPALRQVIETMIMLTATGETVRFITDSTPPREPTPPA